jgi:tetratricopeptide (TPR) repeat protein
MRVVVLRIPLVLAACLIGLSGCVTAPFGKLSSSTDPSDPAFEAPADAPEGAGPDAFAAVAPEAGPAGTETKSTTAPGLLGSDSYDELSLGKKHFRASNYGLAEEYFRKAVESHPKDGEAWIGLAAANDRLRRFDLADRAYKEARRILGPTPELLNNMGYSYLLRGDFARARRTLREAQTYAPNNAYIANNLNLLDKVARKGKDVQ